MEKLFALFIVGYFFNLLPFSDPMPKMIVNILIIVLVLVLVFGPPTLRTWPNG